MAESSMKWPHILIGFVLSLALASCSPERPFGDTNPLPGPGADMAIRTRTYDGLLASDFCLRAGCRPVSGSVTVSTSTALHFALAGQRREPGSRIRLRAFVDGEELTKVDYIGPADDPLISSLLAFFDPGRADELTGQVNALPPKESLQVDNLGTYYLYATTNPDDEIGPHAVALNVYRNDLAQSEQAQFARFSELGLQGQPLEIEPMASYRSCACSSMGVYQDFEVGDNQDRGDLVLRGRVVREWDAQGGSEVLRFAFDPEDFPTHGALTFAERHPEYRDGSLWKVPLGMVHEGEFLSVAMLASSTRERVLRLAETGESTFLALVIPDCSKGEPPPPGPTYSPACALF
jgi:hypothetical protein